MYSLRTPISSVKGIGEKISQSLLEKNIYTVKDLLLWLPNRYEDRSKLVKVADAPKDEFVTLLTTISKRSIYYKNKRKIIRATARDESGSVSLMWFNAKHAAQNLDENAQYFVSGKINSYNSIVHPTIESVSGDQLHTGRLVPVYSSNIPIAQGLFRRIIHEMVSNLQVKNDLLPELAAGIGETVVSFEAALRAAHFPETPESVISSRERLAVEELLVLMQLSKEIKEAWQSKHSEFQLPSKISKEPNPKSIPFTLTNAQQKATNEILSELTASAPMNRLLIGDVGSGKTVVAGIAVHHTLAAGHNAALIAPTKILAQQHVETIQKLFPHLPLKSIVAGQKITDSKKPIDGSSAPTLFVGTHAVINRLANIEPGLVIYDEQHKFGVSQRSQTTELTHQPHVLTMTATPIPRSLLLTIFSHLKVSIIDELPPGRIPVTTWLPPEKKRSASYDWMADKIVKSGIQAFVVCPFIEDSTSMALEHVASVDAVYKKLTAQFKNNSSFKKLQVAKLHSKISKKEQDEIMNKMAKGGIDVLVCTPMIEVGVDMPNASIIIVESAERFGLASLHQLRGRVGRGGQESFCIVFPTSKNRTVRQRLKQFSEENDGLKLAELDLKNRGAGDLFGVSQHGELNLQFGSWTNLELIQLARQMTDQFEAEKINYKPLLQTRSELSTMPQAN